MSDISDLMPAVNLLLAAGQMPSADQVRRMLIVIDKQDAEISRLQAVIASERGKTNYARTRRRWLAWE